MVPATAPTPSCAPTAPRARGDGPHQLGWLYNRYDCSPRTRGWSRRRLPPQPVLGLLPAHAGMVPGVPGTSTSAGAAPRARGDGPTTARTLPGVRACSPRTRGWSPCDSGDSPVRPLLPAHAGMVPNYGPLSWRYGAAPRARGDGPMLQGVQAQNVVCSPRTRGWSHHRVGSGLRPDLLPAHAGMVPQQPRREWRG